MFGVNRQYDCRDLNMSHLHRLLLSKKQKWLLPNNRHPEQQTRKPDSMSTNVNLSFFNPIWLNWEVLQWTLGQHGSMNWFSRSNDSGKSWQQEGNTICVKFCTVICSFWSNMVLVLLWFDLPCDCWCKLSWMEHRMVTYTVPLKKIMN